MTKNYWTCAEDFDADMLAISDFCDSSFQRDRETPSDHLRRARTKASIYDDPPEEVEENTTFRPGRGYPLLGKTFTRNPGGIPSFLQQQYQTAKEIREAGGLGFSNDLIERSLKSEQSVSSSHKQQMPDIDLTSSPTSDSSSKYSTPSSSPLTTSSEQSPLHSSNSKHKQEVMATCSKINPVSIYTQQVKVQRNNNVGPPPIYDILRSGKNKPVEKLKGNDITGRTEQHKDYMTVFVPSREKSFNINSRKDFPELR